MADDILSVPSDKVPPVVLVHSTSRKVEEFVAGEVDGESYFVEARRVAELRAEREVEHVRRTAIRKAFVGAWLAASVGIASAAIGLIAARQLSSAIFSIAATVAALGLSVFAAYRTRA